MASSGCRRGLLILTLQLLPLGVVPQTQCPSHQISHASQPCAASDVGAQCEYTCDEGYYAGGVATCNAGKWGDPSWSGGACTLCLAVQHCSLAVCSSSSDQKCKSGRCQEGYQADSHCSPSACEQNPSTIEHATGQCIGNTGDTCSTFQCELGYKTQGQLRCGADGHWTGGSCKGESCHPSTAPHAAAPCAGDYPTHCALQCDAAYYPDGDMRCGRDKKFSGGSCELCDPIERCPIVYGGLQCTKLGDSRCTKCEAGYIPTGTGKACIGLPCKELPAPDHGSIIAPAVSPLRFPSTIAFACEAGFARSDVNNRTCNTDGSWNPSRYPTCIETCELKPCNNGATCTEATGSRQFQCECTAEDGKPFWEGPRCDVNVNECKDPGRWPLNGGCDYSDQTDRPLAQCINQTGGFHCGSCLLASDCCQQQQDAVHGLPCGGSSFNTMCSATSSNWTEPGCTGPAIPAESSFTAGPTAFVAGGSLTVRLDPRDVNKRLSAENGVTAAADVRGVIVMQAPSTSPVPVHFVFQASSRRYESAMPHNVAGAYELNISMHDQLEAGQGMWAQVANPAAFVVVPASADADNTLFGGCYQGTSTTRDSCFCVSDKGCRTLPGVQNQLIITVRDRFDNIRNPHQIDLITEPHRDPGDQVTAVVTGTGLVTSSAPVWPAVNGTGYVFPFMMHSHTEFAYTLKVKVNDEIADEVAYEYVFHANLNSSMCLSLGCHEFYEPARFSNHSRWSNSTLAQDCADAGCLFLASRNPNTFSITLADALPAAGNLRASIRGLCLMNDTNFEANETFQDSTGRGFCMLPADSPRCNKTRFNCFSQEEIIVARAINGAEATEYTVDFTVPHPGWYGFSAEWTDGVGGSQQLTDVARLLIGPGLPDLTKSSFMMSSNRYESKEGKWLTFDVLVVDQDGDPRYGSDEVILQLVRLAPADVPTPQDRDLQPVAALSITLMTERSRLDARRNGFVGEIGIIPRGSTSGRFTARHLFAPGSPGSKGVWKMRTWICPPAGNRSCTMDDKNEIKEPHVPGSEVSEMIFTVCQSNASIDRDFNVDASRSALVRCQCDPGYTGADGDSCTACSAGQFKAEPGSRSCSPCTAGTHCDCAVDPAAETGADPDSSPCINPCTQCDECSISYYQNSIGKKTCVPCPNDGQGFICPLPGMTWPIARPGYWISGMNPTIFHDCAGRPAACKGGLFANSSRLAALSAARSDSTHQSADALLATCFLRSTTAAGQVDATLSGYSILPHDGVQQRFQAAQAHATFDCWPVVGAECAEGYSGSEHDKACVDCAQATQDAPGYFPNSAQNVCQQVTPSLVPKPSCFHC